MRIDALAGSEDRSIKLTAGAGLNAVGSGRRRLQAAALFNHSRLR